MEVIFMSTMANIPGTPEYIQSHIHESVKKDYSETPDESKINLDAKVEETNI